MSEEEKFRFPEWLPGRTEHPGCLDAVYPVELLKTSGLELRRLGHGWLVLTRPRDDLWVKFAVLEFAVGTCGEGGTVENEMASVLFYGEGPAGPLRECRHTYWGENGYVFYPNGALIAEAFRELSEFFDDMVAK